MNQKDNRLVLEGVKLIFKNFGGAKSTFNKDGERRFSILLEDVRLAMELRQVGWNVKELAGLDGEPPAYHLPVKVSYESRVPPRIYQVKSNGKLPLTKDTVALLDYMPILEADITINPYHWTVQGESGVAAYLNTLYAVIDEDDFDRKYSTVPDIRYDVED